MSTQQKYNMQNVKKIAPLSIHDVMTRRKMQMFYRMSKTEDICSEPIQTEEKDFSSLDSFLDRIKNGNFTIPVKVQLTQQERNSIAEYIDTKTQTCFNLENVASSLMVWNFPKRSQIQLFEEIVPHTSNLRESMKPIISRKNIFLLKGKLSLYEKMQTQGRKRVKDVLRKNNPKQFFDSDYFNNQHLPNDPFRVLEENMCLGPIFKTKEDPKSILAFAENALIVEIPNPEYESMLFNYGGISDQKKIQLLKNFPVFDCVSKRILSVIPSIELKHYKKNDIIYEANKIPTSVYLIVKGQVQFQKTIQTPFRNIGLAVRSTETTKNISNEILQYQTETLGFGNYFGEEEIYEQLQENKRIEKEKAERERQKEKEKQRQNDPSNLRQKSQKKKNKMTQSVRNHHSKNHEKEKPIETIGDQKKRLQKAICKSSQCELLEIPAFKFEKLLIYHDFYESIKKSVISKRQQRQIKIKKALHMFNKIQEKYEEEQLAEFLSEQNSQMVQSSNSRPRRRRKSSNIMMRMHGKKIRQVPILKNQEPLKLNMLKSNEDMFNATQKKYRRFTMIPSQKTKSNVKWDSEMYWKVLNLENVLIDEGEIGSPEGKKFFESYRRLQNHVNELKSLRPKTSSSTYRTKLQYIAYLQQFNT